jgi:hypothetical protein
MSTFKMKTYANNRIPTEAEILAVATMTIPEIKVQHLLWFKCLNNFAIERIWTESCLNHARLSIAKQERRNAWLFPIYQRLPKTDMIRTERNKIWLALCLRQHALSA